MTPVSMGQTNIEATWSITCCLKDTQPKSEEQSFKQGRIEAGLSLNFLMDYYVCLTYIHTSHLTHVTEAALRTQYSQGESSCDKLVLLVGVDCVWCSKRYAKLLTIAIIK